MTEHLLLVTLGPVQDFIAQARRTRDLWYGSHLLSELARTAARALADGGARLVFPALEKGDTELERCEAPLRADGRPPRSIANKLVAEVPSGLDPETLARAVRAEVTRYWRDDIAAPVKERCGGLLAAGIDDVWAEQIDTVLEFVASWAPVGAAYADARRKVEKAIAGRKTLREFGPWRSLRGTVPKSSLDGARETVLRAPTGRARDLVHKYRIPDGEDLDAVGLVKRAGGEPRQFVPLVNVALASWVTQAAEGAPGELNALRDVCGRSDVSRVDRALPCVAAFPFDASVLLASRWEAVFKEQGIGGDGAQWGRQYVSPLLEKLSEPYPYVACLVADGDRVGRAIDSLESADDHRRFSRALATFAAQARTVVEEHLGCLVYAGGDDVLAFLPLPEALACAEKLRLGFARALDAASHVLPAGHQPTLSVGIGVGHVLESLGDLLALGRDAEREAKRNRNALAVLVDKRSGGRMVWSAPWTEGPVAKLHESAALLLAGLSSRKVYEVKRSLHRLPKPSETDDETWARVLALEVRRSLTRVGEGTVTPAAAGLHLDETRGYRIVHAEVREWVDRLLIARTFERATPRARLRSAGVAA